jgi:aquaporin Z
MNPARTFGPDLIGGKFTDYWAYIAGPILGGAAAVAVAYVLRGPGGGMSGSAAAQGGLSPRPRNVDRTERPSRQ